jgi:hypothetical protein
MPVMTSTSTAGAEAVMAPLEATTSTEAGAMTARRTAVLHPSHRALESSVEPFTGPNF